METIKLDLIPGKKMPSLHASQYDDGREHGIDLFENGVAYKLDGTETLTINERKVDNNICSMDIENTFTGSSHIVFASFLQMCACAGSNFCELRISKGGVDVGTLNFILEVEPDPTADGIESESEIRNLKRQVEAITEEVIGEDYYTKTQTDDAIANATEGKADTTYVNTELAKKADKTDTYTKTQVDNALNNKMNKANPTGTGSISVGSNTLNVGSNSQTFGKNTKAFNQNTFAAGEGTTAGSNNQFVYGRYNQEDWRDQYVEIVGNGTNGHNSNARTLDWQGNETLEGDLTFNGNKSLTGEITRLDGKIDNLPAPMIFKGTLGVNGTIQSLPTASASNEGYTYKVITDGTYAGQTAKVGDVFTSNGSAWVYIPSGDEDNDTWRAIKVNGVEKLGNGISSGAVDFEDTTNVKFEFDANGNKVRARLDGIYTESDVDDLLDDKADKSDTYTQEQVNTIVLGAIYNTLPSELTPTGAIANFSTTLRLPIVELMADVTANPEGTSKINLTKCGDNLVDVKPFSDWVAVRSSYYVLRSCVPNAVINLSLIDKNVSVDLSGVNFGFVDSKWDGTAQITTSEYRWVIQGGVPQTNKKNTAIGDTSIILTGLIFYPQTQETYNKIMARYNLEFEIDVAVSFNPYIGTTEIIDLGGTFYNGGTFAQDKDGHRTFTADGVTTDLPNGEPIITINGTNNIYADTGDCAVEYKCSVAEYVANHSGGGGAKSLGGVFLGGSNSGSEEEPTEESEETEKTKEIDEPKEEIKTIGDVKKLGGE